MCYNHIHVAKRGIKMDKNIINYIITTQKLENIDLKEEEIELLLKEKRKGHIMKKNNEKFENWEDYLIEGTNILKNIPNIKNENELKQYEKENTTRRLIELIENPIEGEFDINHLYKIHKYLFQDIYEWAGKTRKAHMKKQTVFLEPEKIEKFINVVLNELKIELENITDEYHLASCLSTLFYSLTFAHPFREGNGRTMREFIRQLVNSIDFQFGSFDIDYNRINQQTIAIGINCAAPMFITPEIQKSLIKRQTNQKILK